MSIKNEDLVKDAEQIVRRPSHYCEGRKYEPIDVFSDWCLFFTIGNASKYLSRVGRKFKDKTKEDLQKSLFYINYEINHPKQPLVNVDNINITFDKVSNDWNLSENITNALHGIYEYITTQDIKYLKESAEFIQKEINLL